MYLCSMIEGLLHIHLNETESTNTFLRSFKTDEEHRMTLVTATNQTSGRGQRGNSWESEPGKNVVFSLLVHPRFVNPMQVFCLSEAIALAVCQTIGEYLVVNAEEGEQSKNEGEQSKNERERSKEEEEQSKVAVKWPNDIYVGEKKICGILIENTLRGSKIEDCIIGVGLNVNQRAFLSDAPNPVSIYNLTGKETDINEVLQSVIKHFASLYQMLENGQQEEVHEQYMKQLFRRTGIHKFRDKYGDFCASIAEVESSGHIVLLDTDGNRRRYAFKEVSYKL